MNAPALTLTPAAARTHASDLNRWADAIEQHGTTSQLDGAMGEAICQMRIAAAKIPLMAERGAIELQRAQDDAAHERALRRRGMVW